ncbi:DEAD/DEAH box helicase [Fodinicurvata sp. EGI_FJ10296]|uniref:DEAD/DEAH box helicase n=1 Tax=Fodinicurvata sp. EGI_FJ10296 TaxID=3231908 RepID=UPI0034512614
MRFADLGLKPEILRAIEEVGYTTPTPIQAQAIPIVLQQRDILGVAQTGTGKTAGFTLPMIEILANGRARARMPRSVILEPTRELAAQVAENFELYGKYEKLSYALLIGGESLDDQIKKLDRGVDVLIATPGRLLDLYKRGKVLLPDVKILVIDEADRMLDMGFIPDIEEIVSHLPPIRQTLLFSATMPKEIRRLAERFLSNPKQISVERTIAPAASVVQHVAFVDKADKRAALRSILRQEDVRNALIFCNRKRDVTTVCRSLKKHGFDAGELHGDMAQSARTETLERFKNDEVKLLVCSDVAARGIDISDLSHVFNFDVPTSSDDYIHRIGRTGRAGKSGRAYSLATIEDAKYIASISNLEGISLTAVSVPDVDTVAEDIETFLSMASDDRHGGKKGRGRASTPASGRGQRRGADAQPEAKPESRSRKDAETQATPADAVDAASEQPVDQPETRQAPTVDSDSSKPAGRKRSGRGRSGRTSNGSADARKSEPRGGAEPASDKQRISAAEQHADPSAQDDGAETTGGAVRQTRRRDEDDSVVGMGDHVPAFLLRPVPKLNKKAGS